MFGFRQLGFFVQGSGFWFCISGFGFREVPDFVFHGGVGSGLRVSCFGCTVSNFGLQVCGFEFWVSHLQFRISGFGFAVSGAL